jgi:predicted amidohydrolase
MRSQAMMTSTLRIVDSDGQVKAKMGDEEGVIVAEVEVVPDRKRRPRPQFTGDESGL